MVFKNLCVPRTKVASALERLKIKQDFIKYFKETFKLYFDEHLSFKYFPQYDSVEEISSK